MKNKHFLNNDGFSLIEMVVAVLITGIMMMAVALFISGSRTVYENVSTSAKLQEEALAADKFINELLMEAQAYGTKHYDVDKTKLNAAGETVASYNGGVEVLWIYARNNESIDDKYSYYFLIFEEDTGKLRYKKAVNAAAIAKPEPILSSEKWTLNLTLDNIEDYIEATVLDDYCLIAECMTAFNVDPPHAQENSILVKMELDFKYNNTDYKSNINTLSRNMGLEG